MKEQKKSLLVTKYETFVMFQNETIDSMFCRFNDIIKDLEALDKSYTLGEKNKKILNAIPKEWENKCTAIKKAKDLGTLPLEALLNSLISFELKMKGKAKVEEEQKLKKSLALKATQLVNDDDDDSLSKTLRMKMMMNKK